MRRTLLLLSPLVAACSDQGGLRRFEAPTAPLIGILVSPEALMVPVGATAPLTATGLFEDRTSADLTAQVEWFSSAEGVAWAGEGLDDEGVLHGERPGRAEVWAGLDGVLSPTVAVVVTEEQVEALSVTPTNLTVAIGQEVELVATARWSDGTQAKASSQVRWITNDPGVAIVDGHTLVGAGAGTTKVRAVWDDVESAPVPVTVVTSAAPDLRIVDLSTWTDEDRVTVSVEIENEGDAGASSFWVDAYLDPAHTPGRGALGDDFALVNWIGPHETRTIELVLDGVDQGNHDVTVVVDSGDTVDEADEGNNDRDHGFSVDETEWPADIVVDAFDAVTDGWSIWYWVELSNYGDVRTGPFYLDVYLDRSRAPTPGLDGDYYVDVDSIPPWSSVGFEIEVPESCDWCESWIQADSLDEIPEIYEDDNIAGPILIF